VFPRLPFSPRTPHFKMGVSNGWSFASGSSGWGAAVGYEPSLGLKGKLRSHSMRQSSIAADIARSLASHAEEVCRHYLFNGRRTAQYWHVGDVFNTPGQSLYVRLSGSRMGKWCDAATGEHGDLLDLIALNQCLTSREAVLAEACRFLALPWALQPDHRRSQPTGCGLSTLPRRIFGDALPIARTIGEAYLQYRGIYPMADLRALRFHPMCFYRANDTAPRETRPALIAAVTDLSGRITGIERTWLDASGSGKAQVPAPRRALGSLLGNGVRFGGSYGPVLAAGEGLETVLSLKSVMGDLPLVAALSASKLARLVLPRSLRRLYVACDADAAGWGAYGKLAARARAEGFDAVPLRPTLSDFNDDLRILGPAELVATLRPQIAPSDRHFLESNSWSANRQPPIPDVNAWRAVRW
jgi:Toprim domain-containing protein